MGKAEDAMHVAVAQQVPRCSRKWAESQQSAGRADAVFIM